ncbi:glycogen/starch synthase, partial [Lawsonibacter sp. DFI.6.74]|nr:glycogen/starch synthase [Lawsonibacter sp. DFI.6.74]
MKILFTTSEAVPFAKTGGLADVAGALPQALAGLGHSVTLALPRYAGIDLAKWNAQKIATLTDVTLYKALLP